MPTPIRAQARARSRHQDSAHPDDTTFARARDAWHRGDPDRAAILFDQALADEPEEIELLLAASRFFGRRHDPRRMHELAKRLLERAGHNAGVCHALGLAYAWLPLHDRARDAFERALAADDSRPDTILELARLDERQGRDEAAIARLERLPDHSAIEPATLQARILRKRGKIEAARHILTNLTAESTSANPDRLGEALGELALVHDALREPDEAVQAIERSKSAQRSRDRAEAAAAAHVTMRFAKFYEDLTTEDLARWTAHPDTQSSHRVALLAGFPRSGTTLLEKALDAHPAIASIEERDVLSSLVFPRIGARYQPDHPIADILRNMSKPERKRHAAAYLKGLRNWADTDDRTTHLLDKNPGATLMIPALLRLIPDARVVFALRDPRDVVLSCYLRYLPLNPVSVNYLTLERTARRYAFEMDCWLELKQLRPEGFIEVRYEDTVEHFEPTVRRVLDTLGLDWSEQVLTYRERLADRPATSPTYAEVASPIRKDRQQRWRAYETHLRPVLHILRPYIQAFGYD